MKAADVFIDTNVFVYLFSADTGKADRAEARIAEGGVVSVQVLNEFATVARRKVGLGMGEVREALAAIRAVCRVVPLDAPTHDVGLDLCERHGFAVYDAMIVASALGAGCNRLLSEDFQHGQRIDGRLLVEDPFRRA